MRASISVLSIFVLLCASTSAFARDDEWRPGDAPPPGFHVETQSRVGAIVGGSIVFGVPYAISAFAATAGLASSSTPELAALYVPVAGPWITLGLASATSNQSCCGFNPAGALVGLGLVADGVMQLAGAVWLTYGLASKKQVLVPNGASFAAAPFATPHGAGLAVVGTF